jgi:hypothetical protein
MTQKSEFRTVEFFRKVRDEQAALLVGKPHNEILAFFAPFDQGSIPEGVTRQPAPSEKGEKAAGKGARLEWH